MHIADIHTIHSAQWMDINDTQGHTVHSTQHSTQLKERDAAKLHLGEGAVQ